MAQPSTELNTYRDRVTSLLNVMYRDIQAAIDVVEGTGTTDAQRKAFFQAWIDAQGDYDITADEFIASVLALRALRDWLEANMVDLARMRI